MLNHFFLIIKTRLIHAFGLRARPKSRIRKEKSVPTPSAGKPRLADKGDPFAAQVTAPAELGSKYADGLGLPSTYHPGKASIPSVVAG